MPNIIEILPNVPSQSFNIEINDIDILFKIKWNSRAQFWTADLIKDESELISGIALKTGVNLLEPFNFGLGGIFVIDSTGSNKEMTLSNVGADVYLVHFDEGEL